MGSDDDAGSNLLTSLGTLHIWLSLIFLPVACVVIIALMVIDAKWQQGWQQGTATCQETVSGCPSTGSAVPYRCTVRVTIDRLPDQTYTMQYSSRSPSVEKGQSWQVAFDPKDVAGTLTQDVATPSSRTTTLILLGVALATVVLVFVVNVVFRKNRTFKEVSGVMEIGSLANSFAGGFR